MRHLDLEVLEAASAVDSVVAEASVEVVDSVVVTVSVLVEELATKVVVMDLAAAVNHPPTLPLVLVVAAGEISEVVEETLVEAGETTVEALTVVVVVVVVVADLTAEVVATESLCAHEMALRIGTAATTGTVIATETATAVMTAMEETATVTVTVTDTAVVVMLAGMAAERTLDGSDPVKTMATMTPDPGDDTKCSPSCEWMLLSPFSALTCWWVSLIRPARVFLFSRVMG
jgi:hypothetical protein